MKLTLKNCLRIWNFLPKSLKRLAVLSVGLGVVAGTVEYLFIVVLQLFLYSLGVTKSLEGSVPAWVPTTLSFTLSMLVLGGFVRSLANGSKVFVSRLISQLFFKTIRERILAAALSEHSVPSTSSVLSMFSDETTRAGIALMNLSTGIIALVNGTVLLALCLNVAFEQTIVGIGLLFLIAIPILLLSRLSKTTGNDISQAWTSLNERLISSIRNHFFLNIYGLLNRERNKANKSLESYFRHFRSFVLMTSLKTSIPLFFGTIVIAALSLYSVNYAPIGGATLLSFLYLFLRIIQAAAEFAATTNDFAMNRTSLFTIQNWLSDQQSSSETENLINNCTIVPEGDSLNISMQNAFFQYGKKEIDSIIENLSLNIKTGECLVITGESGSGKSTLVSLLLGVIKTQAGEITINKQDIRSMRTWLSANVSYVGPSPYIVEGTILDNLLYGHPASSKVEPSDIWQALRNAELFEFVKSLPDDLQTPLNDIASRLSTGQRQRLTIARALLRNPRIVVLDEASSNLDQHTEEKILQNLKPLLPNWVTIVVSHRPAFMTLATQRLHLKSNTYSLNSPQAT